MQMWSLHRILSVLHKVTFSVLLAVQVVVAFWLLTRSVNIFALILFLVFLTLVGVAFFISLMERKKQSEPTLQMHSGLLYTYNIPAVIILSNQKTLICNCHLLHYLCDALERGH